MSHTKQRRQVMENNVTISTNSNMFSSLEEQIAKLLKINEQVWKDLAITEEAIRKLGYPPECSVSNDNGLYCTTLFYETGDVVKTFERNWQACIFAHHAGLSEKAGHLIFSDKGVRQRQGARPRSKGLRWDICELGRQFQGERVKDVYLKLDQHKLMGIGQELPFIAAMHPRWAIAMNGKEIPRVDAPDLVVSPYAGGDFYEAPRLYFICDFGWLNLGSDDVRDRRSMFGSGSLRVVCP